MNVSGRYVVSAVCDANEYYEANMSNYTFRKNKKTTDLNVTVEVLKDYKISVNVNVSSGVVGFVNVDINGTGYLLSLNGSVNQLNITLNRGGNYNINVTYLGNEKFESRSVTNKIAEVPLINHYCRISGINASYSVGDVVTFNVESSHSVTVKVNDTIVNLTGNVYSYTPRSSGAFEVVVSDGVVFNATSFSVNKKDLNIDIVGPSNVQAGKAFTFNVTGLDDVAPGDVVVKVNGVEVSPAGDVYTCAGVDFGYSLITVEVKSSSAYNGAFKYHGFLVGA